MQDGIIDIVNRSYCYEDSCEPIAIKYRYCIYSSKAKDDAMREKCAKIMNEYLTCKNANILTDAAAIRSLKSKGGGGLV